MMGGTAVMPGRPMGGSSPPPGGVTPGAPHDAGSYSPPVAQQGVNPLGGTVAADGGGFAAAAAYAHQAAQQGGTPQPYGAPPGQAPQYGAPPQQYGAPPQQYGAPPQQQYGAPPQQYGAPPQQYGAPPQQYGAPQQQYGAPPQYGAPAQGAHPMAPQGMMPYGGAMPQNPITGTLPSGGVSAGPTRRNPLMMLAPFAVVFGAIIISIVASIVAGLVGVPIIGVICGFLAMLLDLAGLAWFFLLVIPMVNELKGVTGNPNFVWWPILIPFYSLYWGLILVPQEVTRAKQMRGVQAPVRSLVIYLFLWPFALASDLNDLAR
jgi:hypothetical protein